MPEQSQPVRAEVAAGVLSSSRVSSVLATTAVGTAVLAYVLRQTIGWAGLIAIIVVLVVVCSLSLAAQWNTVGWRGLLPISLLAFVGWAGASVFWSEYQWASLAGFGYLVAFTILGIYIALTRDTIQIIRSYGDVLRVVLLAGLALEVFAGLLIDSRIEFLNIAGNLDSLGSIQGLSGTRNQLGIVAVIALVTFGAELRTKSIPRGLAIISLVAAGLAIVLSRSPVAIGALVLLALAGAALYLLRRVASSRRRFWQFGLLALTVMAAIAAWVLRGPIVAALNGAGELNHRLAVWNDVWNLIGLFPLEGWGWVGLWRNEIVPFQAFAVFGARTPTSSLNAFLDVWLQLGLVGFVIFIGMLGVTFTRSWLLASQRRSIIFAWPALVLVVLLVSSLAESTILIEFGWLTFVVCCVKASRELSWRTAFVATRGSRPN